ncbi:MAG TPA: RagB/SusD family nutrient uptake outer membrane protein [Hanamia sp.]|nr:RagB/SusD family nutrient uptake outer membrane protein [Hanamia sp.]
MKTCKHLLTLLVIITSFSCKKYLDAKPDATLATPAGLNDLQGLLDYYRGMNTQFPGGTGVLSDNYYLLSNNWASIYRSDQRSYYIWQKDATNTQDWNSPYNSIYTCNTVLESLKSLSVNTSEKSTADNIKGEALFFRASFHYGIAQLFTKGYNKTTASTDLGIPLRLSTDFTERSVRATLEETYQQIIADFKQAAQLLPLQVNIKSRPSKAAAYGALARTFLAMSDYEEAFKYADSCLQLANTLIDYNTLDSNASAPFARFNDEVIFQAISFPAQPLNPSICKIDSNLYSSYSADDLRKVVCFKRNNDGSHKFKGDYDGTANNGNGHSFTGIVTDEQYLIRAECAARLGETGQAKSDINHLLNNRLRAGTYIPVTTSDQDSLLRIVLDERRKELLFRGTRWTDMKRLNSEPEFATEVKRIIDGTNYVLPKGEIKYVPLIPQKIIDISGIKQNP